MQNMLEQAKAIEDFIVDFRHQLHMYPELGFQEFRTTEKIEEELKKLGLNPDVDYGNSAIGILNMSPPESAVIASDISIKTGDVYLGFVDRFSGTLIITGLLSEVNSAVNEIVRYFRDDLGYSCCEITRR